MKDLLIYAADADAQGFMRSLLTRPQALGMRPVTFDVERHPQRDAGMVQSGAELVRMRKGQYDKVLLIWDHHGSGKEHRYTPEQVKDEIADRLDRYSWSNNHAIGILVPELEQWLWHCDVALANYFQLPSSQLDEWIKIRSEEVKIEPDKLKEKSPKELFEYVVKIKLKRTISPRDFEEIGKIASVKSLMSCATFSSIAQSLTRWFPLE